MDLNEHPVIKQITDRARQARKRVILPESQDPRVLIAARRITDLGFAEVALIGEPEATGAIAEEAGVHLEGVEVIDHQTDESRPQYVEALHERRKHKGMNLSDAERLLSHPVYYGAMMVGSGSVNGMVSGSVCPTRDTVRAALFGVGPTKGNKTVSSCSIMCTVVPEIGVNGAIILADTGVMPEPNSEQLADIALAAADACQSLLNVEPCVAMLSFSTKGSAYSPSVQKVLDATHLARQRRPELKLDGELQADAALIPEVAERKAKGSPVAGQANTLIVPDLGCGNISYKLIERLGRATALGPLLTGLKRPVNDLSRGCSVEDIVLITAITAVQATEGVRILDAAETSS